MILIMLLSMYICQCSRIFQNVGLHRKFQNEDKLSHTWNFLSELNQAFQKFNFSTCQRESRAKYTCTAFLTPDDGKIEC